MDRTFLQPLWARLVFAVGMAFLAGISVAAGISEGGLAILVGCLAAVVPVVAAIRSWRLQITLGNGVKVVNWFRSYDIAWADVERFGYDGSAVWVRRRSGEQITLAAFTTPPGAVRSAHRRNQKVAQELEAARKRRRGQGGGVDRP